MRNLPDGPLRRLVDYYEAMTPASLDALGEVYAEDVAFKDPFNDIRGLDPLRHILRRMYEDLEDARFEITEAVGGGDQAFLIWDFTFRVKRWNPSVVRRIHGATNVRFDAQGKVAVHRDYWDAAEELYEKLPVVGALVRALRRKLG